MPTWKDRLIRPWMKTSGTIRTNVQDAPAPLKAKSLKVPAEYRPLYKYLDDRYANTVVLTFDEVEDLLGFKLPAIARAEKAWWADAGADGSPSAQARSWTEANRTATANLLAHNVIFERASP